MSSPTTFAKIPDDERAEIMRLYDQNVTLDEIGRQTGRSATAVCAALQRWRVRRDRRLPSKCTDPTFLALRRKGLTAGQIAEQMGVRTRQVENWVHEAIKKGLIEKHRAGSQTRWTDAHVDQLKAMWAEGQGPTLIAERLPFSKSAITSKARKLGLPKAAYPRKRRAAPPRDYAHLRQAADEARARLSEERRLAVQARLEEAERMWTVVPEARPFLARQMRECAWPLGQRGNYMACCKPTPAGDSYCARHRMLAGGQKTPKALRTARSEPKIGRGSPTLFDRAMAA